MNQELKEEMVGRGTGEKEIRDRILIAEQRERFKKLELMYSEFHSPS